MTIQNTFSSGTDFNQLDVDDASLENVRRCLVATGFELLEMREYKDGRCDETWSHPASTNKVRLNVISPESKTDRERDAFRSELVSEVIDLWFELRAIRNLLSDDLDDMLVLKEESPMERFFKFVLEFRKERENAPDTWKFMFSEDVDETICAFNELEESDRLAILH